MPLPGDCKKSIISLSIHCQGLVAEVSFAHSNYPNNEVQVTT